MKINLIIKGLLFSSFLIAGCANSSKPKDGKELVERCILSIQNGDHVTNILDEFFIDQISSESEINGAYYTKKFAMLNFLDLSTSEFNSEKINYETEKIRVENGYFEYTFVVSKNKTEFLISSLESKW